MMGVATASVVGERRRGGMHGVELPHMGLANKIHYAAIDQPTNSVTHTSAAIAITIFLIAC